ncbi:ATP-binding protein, partial [Streptomyces sp. NPDC088135]|uniref:sensor histidine kinase n=1 Tax=Streptomyces sp. NPDC088135 TaxID=3160993 RepID=UPI0034237187
PAPGALVPAARLPLPAGPLRGHCRGVGLRGVPARASGGDGAPGRGAVAPGTGEMQPPRGRRTVLVAVVLPIVGGCLGVRGVGVRVIGVRVIGGVARERPAQAIEGIAYFTVSELLQNVSKHARATRASVDVWRAADRLMLQVTDDGRGGADVSAGSGLAGLTERLEAVDGVLVVDSPQGGPTQVTAELPWRG